MRPQLMCAARAPWLMGQLTSCKQVVVNMFKRLILGRNAKMALSLLLAAAAFIVTVSPKSSIDKTRNDMLPLHKEVNTSCHAEILPKHYLRMKEVDTLQDGSVFFFETSPLPFFMPKQLCSLESAALHHPNKSIILGVLNPEKLDQSNHFPSVQALFEKYENIHFVRVNLEEWIQGTVLESILLKSGKLHQSKYRVANTSNALRLLAMLKYGGIYLDLDSFVIRSLDGLGNTIGMIHTNLVNSGVLTFKKNHAFLMKLLSAMAERFDGDTWGKNGPELFSEEARKWCSDEAQNASSIVEVGPGSCPDNLVILPPQAFYPIHTNNWPEMFSEDVNVAQHLLRNVPETYVVTFWNRASADTPILPSSFLGQIASRNCPVISNSSAGGKLWGLLSLK